MTAPVVNNPPEFSPSTPTDAPTDTAETVPMTAPVLTTGAQATQAPKTTQTMGGETMGGQMLGGQTMAFVLPSTFRTVSSAPLPTDPAVRLRARPERLMAAIRFSGRCTDALAERKAAELHAKLVETGCVGGEEERPPFEVARYNPPWTLPPLRTNEVLMGPLENAKVATAIGLDLSTMGA